VSSQNVEEPFSSGLDLDWLGSISDNLRFTFDMSGRFEYDTAREEWSISQYYGFDLFKVLSNKQGDYATILLQGYATGLDNNPAPPFIFDGPTDWEWIYRMFYINWKLAPRDALNLKIGHFEMPFGLEMDIDTNGTLRQFGTAPNLGIKADWGLTLNGVSSMSSASVAEAVSSGRLRAHPMHSSAEWEPTPPMVRGSESRVSLRNCIDLVRQFSDVVSVWTRGWSSEHGH
jgi:hypothetical protein